MSARDSDRPTLPWRGRAVCLAVIVAAIALGAWFALPARLPDALANSAAPPGPSSCAQCHEEQVEALAQAPHANTLRRMAESRWMAHFIDARPGELEYTAVDEGLEARLAGRPKPINLAWAFGSGKHAMTPVAVWENPWDETELLEHRWSFYPPDQIDATLGQESLPAAGLAALGHLEPRGGAARCFGCHSTRVPQEKGKIDFTGLIPGVQCDRCHLGSASHVAAMQGGDSATRLESWRQLTCRESVNRCGECHRRADEFTPDELRPDNRQLARFAPVGLSQSWCFQASAFRAAGHPRSLTCVTCHDPHRAAESDPAYYRDRCLTCHDGAEKSPRSCSQEPAASHCATCHMPKVPLNGRLTFTDHWIRRPLGVR